MGRAIMELRKLIRETRIGQGLTQRELADRSGLSRSQIGRIESGECIPRVSTLDSIVAALSRRLNPDTTYAAYFKLTQIGERELREAKRFRGCEKVLRAMLRAIRDKEIK